MIAICCHSNGDVTISQFFWVKGDCIKQRKNWAAVLNALKYVIYAITFFIQDASFQSFVTGSMYNSNMYIQNCYLLGFMQQG